CRGRARARSRDGELPDRGARARRSLVQLPQARRDRDDRRSRREDGERAGRDSEFRQEVDRRGQGDARHARPDAARRERRRSGRLGSAPSSNTCRLLARDHAAPESALVLAKAESLGRERVRPVAWCSRPRSSAASLEGALMRHQRAGRKLGRDAAHRKALYANLTASLIEHGRIKTTVAKAKEVRPVAEEMITLGRRGDVPARRQALKFLRSQDVVHKLFSEVGPRFSDRPGGYSRIVKLGPPQGDPAAMAYLELVDYVPGA